MDEEITIINESTKNEKIKNFFIKNKKKITVVISIIIFIILGYFTIVELKERDKIKLANQFNLATIYFKDEEKQKIVDELKNIVNQKDVTYSPLALYFLIDNSLIDNNDEINKLFDQLINETNLEKEIKNLIIYKKGLFNSNFAPENVLIKILNPIINSESIWKSHALYLLGEFFYSKNESQKAKEFFNQIMILPDSNNNIKLQAKKRLNRDLSE
jgi:predicted negative regulator of RcsB-dependent stress response